MKTKFVLYFALLFFVLLICCKKKPATETQPNYVGTTTGVPSLKPPTDFSKCYGEILFQEYITIGKDESGVTKMPIECRFYTKIIGDSQKQDLDVGTVKVNNIVLKRFGGAMTHRVYSDTTNQLFSLSEYTLNASGTAVTPRINFEYGGGSPAFGDTSAIPGLVERSKGIHLTLKNLSNADSMIFSLERNPYQAVKKQIFVFNSQEAKIDMSREEISDLMESNVDATIRVIIFKKALTRTGGKDYLTRSVKVYSRPVMVSFF